MTLTCECDQEWEFEEGLAPPETFKHYHRSELDEFIESERVRARGILRSGETLVAVGPELMREPLEATDFAVLAGQLRQSGLPHSMAALVRQDDAVALVKKILEPPEWRAFTKMVNPEWKTRVT